MEDRETPRMHKYGESKTTQIMMATVPYVTAWAGRTKYTADGFLFDCTVTVGLFWILSFPSVTRDKYPAQLITDYVLFVPKIWRLVIRINETDA